MTVLDPDEMARIIALPAVRAATIHNRGDRIAVYLLLGAGSSDDWLEEWLGDFETADDAAEFAKFVAGLVMKNRATQP